MDKSMLTSLAFSSARYLCLNVFLGFGATSIDDEDSDEGFGFGSGLQLPLDSRLAGWDVEPGFELD